MRPNVLEQKLVIIFLKGFKACLIKRLGGILNRRSLSVCVFY